MTNTETKKIFLSWSGSESKKIAEKMKEELSNFFGNAINIFFSAEDIRTGEEWFAKIKEELKQSDLGILCVTKENFDSPWLYFEAGAMIACGIKVFPILFGAKRMAYKSPMDSVNNIVFERKEFCKFLKNINDELDLGAPAEHFDRRSSKLFTDFQKSISSSLKLLEGTKVFSVKYVYPKDIKNVDINTLYISTPMASIGGPEYGEQHEFLVKLDKVLKDIGFKNIIAPALEIENQSGFDGSTKANFDNYGKMKQVDSFMIIYPNPMPSSVLVEIGYAIALTKRIVLFTKKHKNLPFMLREADKTIPHLRIYEYNTYEDILEKVVSNKMALFEMAGDDEK